MVVTEFPSELDVAKGTPLSGFAGDEFGKMLNEAGILRSSVFTTCALRTRPPANDPGAFIALKKNAITPQHGVVRDKYCLPPVWEGLEMLKREIELVQPHVIIALGNVSLWMLTGKWGITSWRGSMMQTDLDLALDYKPKVLPTYTPSMVMRQWSTRPIVVQDLRRAKGMAASRELIRPDYHFITRPDYPTVMGVLNTLLGAVERRQLRLAPDIETRAGHIACIGFAWSNTEALCIPLMCVERREGYWTEDEEHQILWALYRLLTHPNVELVGQNFLYDSQYFWRHLGYNPRLVRDTMLAAHCCFSTMQKSLDFLASMHCEYYCFWKDDGKDWDERTGEDQLWVYNCQDAVYTFEVDTSLRSTVSALKLDAVHDFQQRLYWPVLRTMNRGLRYAHERRAEFATTLVEEIAKRETWIADVLGHPLNIRSSPQMQELFYGVFNCKPVLDRKTGNPTCNDEALGRIASREPLLRPLVKKIQELRSLGVFLSTFVNAPVDADGRMRCSFNIAGTETYRFSSSTNAFGSGLNLQNIPKGGGNDDLELPNVRSLFVPDPGHTFFDIDLSSADLRIVVWESDEPEFKAMLKAGADPYTEIAKEFYHDPTITKKDPRRQTFKSFAHGTNYLGTAKGLAERLGLSVHQAEQTQKWYFGRFPRIKKWQDDLRDQVTKRRMVQNVFGYRWYIFDRIEGTIFNQAAAWIPQSTVACLINRAYVAIDEQLPWCQVLLQVHDSLAGQFPAHMGQAAVDQIVRLAEIPLPYADPLTIGVGVKTSTVSWGECD